MPAFFGFMRLTLIGSARTHPVERERERCKSCGFSLSVEHPDRVKVQP